MIKSKTVFKGKRFTIKQGFVRAKSGRLLFNEVAVRQPSVAVLAFKDNNHLLINREYRHHLKKTTWRLPAGGVDKGYSPLKAAQQELLEETGYRAKKWRLFFRTHQRGAILYRVYFYLARNLSFRGKYLEQDEIIKTKIVSLNKAYQIALEDGFNNEHMSFVVIKLWHERKKRLKNKV